MSAEDLVSAGLAWAGWGSSGLSRGRRTRGESQYAAAPAGQPRHFGTPATEPRSGPKLLVAPGGSRIHGRCGSG
eukprot:7794938-Alexandrium_andersonii.AAC.1